jgi:hypothetical protein
MRKSRRLPFLETRVFQFHWWPKLRPLSGWHQDRELSLLYSANALAPDGFTFKNAETVMYAKAIYKPREPNVKSIKELIEKDKKDFEANVPGVLIQEAGSLFTGDGQELRSFTFFPATAGNWEHASYGKEGEFYLIFTASSRSKSGFESAARAYEKLVASYRK